jgi:hypothetical protein
MSSISPFVKIRGLVVRLLVITIILIYIFASFPLEANAASTQQQINVLGYQPWTDTGIDLRKGYQVSITASGTIYIAGSPILARTSF